MLVAHGKGKAVLCVCILLLGSVVYAKSSVEDEEFEDENIEPFIATHEWQQVKPGAYKLCLVLM